MDFAMGRLEDWGELELQTLRNAPKDFPGGPVVESSPASGGDRGSIPILEDSTMGAATKPANHTNRSHCKEKARHFNPRVAPARQSEKAHVGQQRPSAAN